MKGYLDNDVTRPADLPDYTRPPVDEVVIGVQFPPIEGFSEPHVGIYWQRVRSEFPKVQSQPRLEGPIEDLEAEPFGPPALTILQGPGAAQGRTWMISENDVYLVQIQNSRFVLNWRRRGDGEYPHFEAVAERFWDQFSVFRDLLESEGLVTPVVQQLEVTYINWIADLPVHEFFCPAQVANLSTAGVGPLPQDQAYMARYLARDAAGVSIGRLYVQCQSAMRVETPQPEVGTQFTLTFKAPSKEPMTDDQLRSLSAYGREGIVRGFTDLTTDAAQASWGRTQ
jgi:uncharacterized protein (TIGR04255 family)